jgi:hypothetical protein
MLTHRDNNDGGDGDDDGGGGGGGDVGDVHHAIRNIGCP